MGKLKITLADLFSIPSAVIYNPDCYRSLSKVEIDSRKVTRGTLFFAIKGEKFDGHNFVLDSIKKGASAIVVSKNKLKKFADVDTTIIAVDDTIKAYGDLANIWRHKLSTKVLSLSGSNGKTSTKEILAQLLSKKYRVVKTEANNNNHIGVPLTIFSADENCGALLLEQGTNHFGEILYTAKIAEPDFALLTNIGDSHLEFLIDREGVYKEKSELLRITDARGGRVLLNTDDKIINVHLNEYKNKTTYGFSGKVDIKGKLLGFTPDGKTRIQIQAANKKFETTIPLYGESNAKNYLAAAAAALELGVTAKEIISATQKLTPVHGRLEVMNYKQAVLIDDTYNSSPVSVEAAYNLLTRVRVYKNKILVLGDIFELGAKSVRFHKDLARLIHDNKNLLVLTLGGFMKHLNTELRKKKMRAIHFETREELSLYLKYMEIENSVVLVKGSRGMKMEEFVNILKKRFS